MLFNTVHYILFLSIIVLVNYILPIKVRYIWLLGASYFFYMQWNPLYIILLFFYTVFTYVGGKIIAKLKDKDENMEIKTEQSKRQQRLCLFICILVNLSILFYFKYFGFAIESLNHLLHYLSVNINYEYDILLPVGISFYILQALGYLIDVYRGNIDAEKNIFRYALFVSFFPQLVAGPIERSKNLLQQLRNPQPYLHESFKRGLILILYGLFIKMVIADRAAIIVDKVYGESSVYTGFYILVATILFSIQIYCDFYGYSTIARGSALLLGINLMDNFESPYFSRSIKEFWRRWHISLSGWFRDYLYIPLGGNQKGEVRKECNLLIVFITSGLWHGASLSFVFWGGLNGIYQIVADIIRKMKHFVIKNDSMGIVDSFSKRLNQRLVTFMLITFAWLFFRAGGLGNAYTILINMFHMNNWTILFDGSLYELGVKKSAMNILVVSILGMFIVDYYKYKGKDVVELLMKQQWYFKTLVIIVMFFMILLYGCYGEMYDIQQFIYFQF